jgi:23S rRNA A2030 N6-methylase RlmJ
MKPINALLLATLAGFATFVAQYNLFPARLHAASYVVPIGVDWRQQMLDRYPGGSKVDHVVGRLSDRLALNDLQASEAHTILQRHHEHILALLVSGPRSMTRDQFVTAEKQAWADTRKQLDALLTPEQRQLMQDMPRTS